MKRFIAAITASTIIATATLGIVNGLEQAAALVIHSRCDVDVGHCHIQWHVCVLK